MDPRKKRIRRVRRLAEAAVPLKHFWEVPDPGRGKKLPRQQKVQSGNPTAALTWSTALLATGRTYWSA